MERAFSRFLESWECTHAWDFAPGWYEDALSALHALT